jgi:flagellar hook-associated protein 3 FlgL
MRITNKMITAQYTRSLNNLSIELNRLNTQVASERKFAKSSEDTSAAIKAFQIRKDLAKAEGYQNNIAHAKASLTDAESALAHIEELLKTSKEKIIFALNGTQSEAERAIVATELRNIQDQLFQTLNSNSSDSYYFGGTNTSKRPFEIKDGKLQYNGYSLELPLPDGSQDDNEALLETLEKDSLYVDIGLGVSFDEQSGKIDDSTVFDYSIAGINIVGKGSATIENETVSANMYDLLGALADEFESGTYSHDKANSLFSLLGDAADNISKCMTKIGAKTSYLEFMTERMEDRTFNLKERQVSVEGIDPAAAIIEFESQKFAYAAALQMGTKVIQPTIFDFMS